MNYARAFGRFWYDFIVGDDWRLALAVVLTLAAVAVAAHFGATWVWFAIPVAVLGSLGVSLWKAADA